MKKEKIKKIIIVLSILLVIELGAGYAVIRNNHKASEPQETSVKIEPRPENVVVPKENKGHKNENNRLNTFEDIDDAEKYPLTIKKKGIAIPIFKLEKYDIPGSNDLGYK
jgi:hypothetical protein